MFSFYSAVGYSLIFTQGHLDILKLFFPVAGDRLEPLYGPIRHKLANALTNWHPSDPSAKMILQPWIKVFSRGHMEAFLVKNIIPKLALVMQEFLINPHEQHLGNTQSIDEMQ